MPDMTPVLVAKSDQINGPDLIAAPRVVKIAGVRLTGKEQATEISIEGDDKLWRPCKTVVRLLARAWGNEGNNWVGKNAQLFYDADVRYGKDKPGGVRVSHLSDLASELTVCLQVRKGVVKEYTIKPLATVKPSPAASLPDAAAVTPSTDAGQSTGAASNEDKARIYFDNVSEMVNLTKDRMMVGGIKTRAEIKLKNRPELLTLLLAAIETKLSALDGDMDDGFGGDA